MKALDEVLKQGAVYLHDWTCKRDVVKDFEYYPDDEELETILDSPKFNDVNILFASYGYEDYNGDAFVLFKKEGKLYEVNGSHCSCFGLEGQCQPEETELLALKMRLENGNLGTADYAGNNFADELKQFLGI